MKIEIEVFSSDGEGGFVVEFHPTNLASTKSYKRVAETRKKCLRIIEHELEQLARGMSRQGKNTPPEAG